MFLTFFKSYRRKTFGGGRLEKEGLKGDITKFNESTNLKLNTLYSIFLQQKQLFTVNKHALERLRNENEGKTKTHD